MKISRSLVSDLLVASAIGVMLFPWLRMPFEPQVWSLCAALAVGLGCLAGFILKSKIGDK